MYASPITCCYLLRIIPPEFEVTTVRRFKVLVPAETDVEVQWTLRVVEKKPSDDLKNPVVRQVLFDYDARFVEPTFEFSNLQIWMAQRVFTPGTCATCIPFAL